jgi:hypothetical protein
MTDTQAQKRENLFARIDQAKMEERQCRLVAQAKFEAQEWDDHHMATNQVRRCVDAQIALKRMLARV